jgi:hypothetical protein
MAMRSRWASSMMRWRLMVFTIPAVMPPTMAMMGMENTRNGTNTSAPNPSNANMVY